MEIGFLKCSGEISGASAFDNRVLMNGMDVRNNAS
jgi:hypothetical protein